MRAVLRLAVISLVCLTLVPSAPAQQVGALPSRSGQAVVTLQWPAQGTVTEGFGFRRGRLHSGLDIGILRSLDVRAAASGTVARVGHVLGFEGYGTIVLVAGDGFETLYAHLARSYVRVGEWVIAGERIGLAGCTGACTGTHLHFELRLDGISVDPVPFLAPR
jgi:murein DD-endopeptidase MepM/ murein hydrolase activator NlpD